MLHYYLYLSSTVRCTRRFFVLFLFTHLTHTFLDCPLLPQCACLRFLSGVGFGIPSARQLLSGAANPHFRVLGYSTTLQRVAVGIELIRWLVKCCGVYPTGRCWRSGPTTCGLKSNVYFLGGKPYSHTKIGMPGMHKITSTVVADARRVTLRMAMLLRTWYRLK